MGVFFAVMIIIVIFIFLLRRKKKRDRLSWSNDGGNFMTLDNKYNASKVKTQKKIDRLLDKISDSGYDSLSKSEKDLLNEYSKKV